MTKKTLRSDILITLFVVAVYAFLYAPILVLIIFSFNKIAFPYHWTGFTLDWYRELFASPEVWHAAKNSFIVATISSFLSIMFGLLIVFYGALSKIRGSWALFYINLMIPEIVLALGLLTLFSFFGVPLGLITLIAGHTVLGLGYSVPILTATFEGIDYSIVEASFDLGATINQTFYKVIVPVLLPALIASALLVFIISLDDFLIAFFCAGSSAQTLPLYIFAMIRSGVSPIINALSTLLLLASSLVVLIFSFLKLQTRVFS